MNNKTPLFSFFSKGFTTTTLICQVILGCIAFALFGITIILSPHDQLITLLWHYALGGILAVALIIIIQKYNRIGVSVFGIIAIIVFLLIFSDPIRELVGLSVID